MRTVSPAPITSCIDWPHASPWEKSRISPASVRMKGMVGSSGHVEGFLWQQRHAVESVGAQHRRFEMALGEEARGLRARRLADALALGGVAKENHQLLDEVEVARTDEAGLAVADEGAVRQRVGGEAGHARRHRLRQGAQLAARLGDVQIGGGAREKACRPVALGIEGTRSP